jgi:arsenite-transporting ATPase
MDGDLYPFPLLPLDWLEWHTRFLLFTGKGGVGKTTIASTVAVRLAEAGKRVLVVSTDPASNLDDVFALTCGETPMPVPDVAGLFVMNLDPETAAASFRERVIAPYRGVLPASAIRSMEEQLSGACTVEIAAFNEFTSIIATPTLAQQFDQIIFDTAPTGHTLRLLSLPSAWSGFLATNSTGTSCLGPLAGLEAQQVQYRQTIQTLADARLTTLLLVSRPEVSALQEAARAGAELRTLGITNQQVILNGLLTMSPGADSVAQAQMARQQRALQSMPEALRGVLIRVVPLVASHLTGVAALRELGHTALEQTVRGSIEEFAPDLEIIAQEGLDDLVRQLAAGGRGVVMLMGKGGVGKTTLAAAVALSLARQGYPVHLSTTDPAAHVSQAVGQVLPTGLRLSRIDPTVETERYKEEVLKAAGLGDDEERALLEEDLRSPCTEEIAVFRAFARTVQEAEEGFVILDTAPTGHTLLLLDAAQSYHREVARTVGDVPESVRALLPRLRDPHFTKILIVTLAETTPVHEAARLQADLRRAEIEPFGWVINASLANSGTKHPLLLARSQLEWPSIQQVHQHEASRLWLVPWYHEVPTGEVALTSMTRKAGEPLLSASPLASASNPSL